MMIPVLFLTLGLGLGLVFVLFDLHIHTYMLVLLNLSLIPSSPHLSLCTPFQQYQQELILVKEGRRTSKIVYEEVFLDVV